MRQAKLSLALAALNVVLLAMVIWQANLLRQKNAGADSTLPTLAMPPGQSSSSSLSDSGAPNHGASNRPAGPTEFSAGSKLSVDALPLTATDRPVLDWRQVESEDYRTYIKNLRSIGVPEQTIRDIVSADVLDAFTVRRAEVAAGRYQQFNYWEFDDAADAEYARRRREVDAGVADVLRQLLGPDVLAPPTDHEWKAHELAHQLAFLPPETREQVEAVWLRYNGADVQLPRPLSRGRLTGEQAEELHLRLAAFDQMRAELGGLLPPGQLEHIEMSLSYTAHNLRQGMANFHPSEAEFQAIFRAWRPHDETVARVWAAGERDPGNQHVFQQIREFLGEERYREYRETWWR